MCREWVDVEPALLQDPMGRVPSMRGDLGHSNQMESIMGTGKALSSVFNSTRGTAGGSAGRCKACERKQSCSSCLVDLGCGWCYYSHNPQIGVCKAGDFQSPAAGNGPFLPLGLRRNLS